MDVTVCAIPSRAVRQLPIRQTEIGALDLGVKLGRCLGRLSKEQLWTWCWDIGYASSARNIVGCFFILRIVQRRLKQRRKYVAIHPLSDLDQAELDAQT
jgi:hypothetical protein